MEKQQSVFVVKTISEQKIQSMGAQNLKDVLLNENNVQLSNDPILGTGINLLGLSGQAVKILIDGVPMIGRLNGNIDLSQINLNNIQKIEIIEGPMAVKYGTDAMGGVINIITKKNKDKKFSDKFLSYYESNGTYNINNTTLFQYNKHHFNITLGRNFFDGWRPDEKPFSFEKIKVADTLRNKLWKPREQYYATINDDIVFQKLTLGLYADGFYEIITDRGKPFAPYYETAIDNIYRTMRNTQRSTLKGFLINDYYLDAVAARTDYLRIKNAYYKDLTTLDQQLTTNSGDQDTSRYTMYMSRSSISKKILLNHTAEMGYDMYHEKARSSIIKNKAAEQTDIAGFFSYSATIKNNFTIKPAIRFSYNSLYHTPLIPSIHLLYNFSNVSLQDSLAESKHSSLRFSYAKGFRTPSLKELFLNFVDINHNIIGNSHLKPEVSDFWNLNYHLQYRKNKFSYTLEGTAFYNDVRNVITLGMINAVQYSYINVDRIQTTGANIGNTFVYRQLSISSKVSFIGKKFNINANSAFYCYPEIICNIQYLYKKWNTGFNVFSKYTGKMPYVKINSDNASSLTYMKDYYWMDMNIYKNLWKDKLQITLGIKNLFNLTILNASASNGAHSSSQTLLGTGRTYFIQLILNI
ncbi:MAG: TonB-dependent receptor plug domain-containing protein [Bacteroidia bacterium]|nr:TonB-dependent receptor plug domain-containing protein [Bacteroidia bacterium]